MNATELKNAFHKLPPLEPESTWDEHRLALRQDVKEHNIQRFTRWFIVNATMFVGEAPYIECELDDLLKDESTVWGAGLHESAVGDPPRLSYCEWTSGNKVHQCYHLQQFVQRTKIHPSTLDWVFEFGGGYGAMCHVMHRLGFKGVYSLTDLPEFLLLQEYYLSQQGIEPEYVSTPVKGGPGRPNLFVALFSLSEAPLDVREYYMERVQADSYLFAYHPTWDGIDNVKWFKSVQDRLPNFNWWDYQAVHKPEYRYLVGARGF